MKVPGCRSFQVPWLNVPRAGHVYDCVGSLVRLFRVRLVFPEIVTDPIKRRNLCSIFVAGARIATLSITKNNNVTL